MIDLFMRTIHSCLMKTKESVIFVLLSLFLFGVLSAQDAKTPEVATDGEKVIPTEISEPPYKIGELISKEGYYIKDDGFGNTLNFRIVGNKIRIYFLDKDKLIMEPPYSVGNVQLRGSVSGRSFHGISRLSGDVGLGAPGFIRPPHLFNLILALQVPNSEDYKSFAFRYSPNLSAATNSVTEEPSGNTSGRSGY